MGQRLIAVQRPLAQMHPLYQRPILEVGRIAHVEALQEIGAVQGQRLAQQADTLAGRLPLAQAQQIHKRLNVQQVGDGAVEGHRVTGD